MGNVQMEARQIRYGSTNVEEALKEGGGSSTLADLTDTNISTPSDGQFLRYDATSKKWVNADIGWQGYACDLLFENDPFPAPESGTANTTRTYTLSHSINDYDAVMVTSYGQHNSQDNISEGGTILVVKPDYNIGTVNEYDKEINTSWGNFVKILAFSFPDATTIKTHAGRNESGNEPILDKVYGLKFAKAVSDNR